MKRLSPLFRYLSLPLLLAAVGVVAPTVRAQGIGRTYPSVGDERWIGGPSAQELPLYRPSIWQGLYAGVHIGADFGSAWSPDISNSSIDMGGVSGGMHLGYNWQSGRVVGGFEIDGNVKGTTGSRGFGPLTVDVSQQWLTSLRARLGVEVGPALIYSTAGFAVADYTVKGSISGLSGERGETMRGYVVGAGVEMKFTDTLSGRLEGLYYGFSEKAVGPLRVDADLATVRAGLTYHFN